ncbi:MAG: HAMP domain-containing histidine kinase [Lachnospiraceae bacterium]|nr:HAMP domain-containing histidine kinase [Lachnospiraceae bacterium]
MKDNYEWKRFRGLFWLCVVVFTGVFWCVAWYCSEFHIGKAFLLTGLLFLFDVILYLLFRRKLRALYGDVDTISALMEKVIGGELDYAAEVYKQGSLGILYTNFFKMVTILRESRMKEGQEKEFLRDTISDISHQLKTPLSSLKVFIELLYDDKIKEAEKRKEVLREAGKQLDRMEWMVLAMLKLARIEAGSIQFEKKECNVTEVLRTAKEAVTYLLDKRKQTIEIVGMGSSDLKENVKVCCDKEWLTEAVINLLKNASDYSGEDACITIRTEENNLFTRIQVEDEGVGIAEEAMPHIFKRFYRVDNAVNPGSVGIGLALTKSIIEGMGGTIKVKSEVGEYTCFTITFLK